MQYALAVDIGGTKATIATNEVLHSTSGDLLGVGIGSAGPLDLTAGTMSPHTSGNRSGSACAGSCNR